MSAAWLTEGILAAKQFLAPRSLTIAPAAAVFTRANEADDDSGMTRRRRRKGRDPKVCAAAERFIVGREMARKERRDEKGLTVVESAFQCFQSAHCHRIPVRPTCISSPSNLIRSTY